MMCSKDSTMISDATEICEQEDVQWLRKLAPRRSEVCTGRVMRGDQARSAALYADRLEQAQAAVERPAMAHWMHEYRWATLRYGLLGERVQTEGCPSRDQPAKSDPTLVRRAPRPAADAPATRQAA
jgi:hypothetical protein